MREQHKIQLKNIEQFDEKYIFEENGFLGKGSYGNLYKLQLKDDCKYNDDDQEQELAVKIFKKEIQLEDQENELLAYYQLQLLKPQFRKFVLNIQDSYLDQESQQISIVIPRAVHNFKEEIQQRQSYRKFFQPRKIYYLLSCALLGQLSIQSVGMVHRDIKLENLLIMKDGSLVITDLGITKRINAHNFRQNTVCTGTKGYWSPNKMEKYQNYEKDIYFYYENSNQAQHELQKDDIYCHGLCFIQAALLQFKPNVQIDNNQYCKNRQEWLDGAFQKLYNSKMYCQEFVNLLKNMLEPDYNKRYSLQQCLDVLLKLNDW